MMPRKAQPCANHEEVKTTLKCHQCEKSICKQCEMRYNDHSFCSQDCINHFKWIKRRERVRERRAKIRADLTAFFDRDGIKNTIEIILILLLILALVLVFSQQKRIVRLENSLNLAMSAMADLDTTALSHERIFTAAEGGMVTTSRIDIQGRAEENWIVTLMKDDRVNSVQLPVNGRFLFENVKLNRGINHLSVRALHPDGQMTQLQTLAFTYAPPTRRYLAEDIRRGPLDKKQMAFTFDGGAENNITAEILDSLKENRIHSTFFLTGAYIRSYPNTVRRIVKEGHEVGNHTWSHPHLTTFAQNRRQDTQEHITRKKVQDELNKTAKLFEMVTGKKMAGLWRAPYGEINPEINAWAAEAGYKHIGWTTGHGQAENMDSMDWVADKSSRIYRTADEIANKILKYAEGNKPGSNGAIVLMHLGSNRRDDFPHQKLPEIFRGLKEKGYEIVTVSEMLLQ